MSDSKEQTIGYRYYVGMHLVFCHGPVDTINKLYIDGSKKDLLTSSVSSSQQVTINKRTIFGGEESGGGVAGKIDLLFGESTQTTNDYLSARLGSLVSAYRGVVSAVLRRLYVGTSPVMKTMGINATRIHKTVDGAEQWYDERAEIGSYVISGAAVSDTADWKILVEPVGTSSDYSAEDVDDSGWELAKLPVGNRDLPNAQVEGFRLSPNYVVSTQTQFWLRRDIYLSAVTDVAIDMHVDNGVTMYVNGVQVFTDYEALDHHITSITTIDASYFRVGVNTIVFFVVDDVADIPLEAEYFDLKWNIVTSTTYGGDMNPAHIIRECLTNPDWGMGYSTSELDDTAFRYAADSFFDEALGISLVWDSTQTIEDFVNHVARHVDAALYVDRKTGLFVLKPIRGDYDEASLLTLDTSNVVSVTDFSRPAFGELTNSVTVTYWDRAARGDGTVTVSDIAMATAQGAAINTAVSYPGITTAEVAKRIAQRDLTTLSSPRISCVVTATRAAADLAPGDVFKLTWPDFKMSAVVMRVTGISFGDGKSHQVRISCTQDVFATPTISFLASSTPVPPDDDTATPATIRSVIEMPYWEAAQRFDQTSVDAKLASMPDTGFLLAGAARPADAAINATLWADPGSGYVQASDPIDFAPYATLDGAIDQLDTELLLSNTDDLLIDDVASALPGTWLICGEEIMQVTDWDSDYLILSVRRGCLDTVPAAHVDGTAVLFVDAYAGTDAVDYVYGESIDVKILPRTSSDEVELAAAAEDTLVMNSRAIRPYPPAAVTVNGTYWLTSVDENFMTLAWNTRNRTSQTGSSMLSWYDASVTEEDGMLYGVRVKDRDTLALIFEDLEIEASPHELYSDYDNARIEVLSLRDGYESWQSVAIDIDIADALLTEDGEQLLTEDGEVIVLESAPELTLSSTLTQAVTFAVIDGDSIAGVKGRSSSAFDQTMQSRTISTDTQSWVSPSLGNAATKSVVHAGSGVIYAATYDAISGNPSAAYIHRLEDGSSAVTTWAAPSGEVIEAIGWDGTYIWSYGLQQGTLRQHDGSTLSVLQSFDCPDLGGVSSGGLMAWSSPVAVVQSGSTGVTGCDPAASNLEIWTTDLGAAVQAIQACGSLVFVAITGGVKALDPSTGAVVQTYSDGWYRHGSPAAGAASDYAYQPKGGIIRWLDGTTGETVRERSLMNSTGYFVAASDTSVITAKTNTDGSSATYIYDI